MEILLVVIVFIFIVKVKKIFSSLFIYINLNIINYIIYSLTGYEILVKIHSYRSTDISVRGNIGGCKRYHRKRFSSIYKAPKYLLPLVSR